MGFRVRHSGSFDHVEKFFRKMNSRSFIDDACKRYARIGVEALRSSTPRGTGKTARSWSSRVRHKGDLISIDFENDNVNDGVHIAIILQYGHGTNRGGYVRGRDYINPAIQPIFDQLAADLWAEVTS